LTNTTTRHTSSLNREFGNEIICYQNTGD